MNAMEDASKDKSTQPIPNKQANKPTDTNPSEYTTPRGLAAHYSNAPAIGEARSSLRNLPTFEQGSSRPNINTLNSPSGMKSVSKSTIALHQTPGHPSAAGSLFKQHNKRTASKIVEHKIRTQTEDSNDEQSSQIPQKRIRRGSPVDAAASKSTDALQRPELLVGYRVEDPNPELNNVQIPVYASLNGASVVSYRLGEEEAKASLIDLGRAPKHNRIAFLPEYQKENEKNTRKTIKDKIESRFRLNTGKGRDNGTETAALTSDDTIIVATPRAGANLEAYGAGPTYPQSGRPPVEELRKSFLDYEGCRDKLREVIDKTISGLEEENTEKDAEAQRLKAIIKEHENKIAGLKQQAEQLAKSRQSAQSDKMVIDGQVFTKFRSGDPNEGLYVTQSTALVEIDGKDYEDKTVLCEYRKLDVGGELKESVTIGGLPFQRISGGKHNNKYIQDMGPRSFCEYEGKTYVRWYIRGEHTPSL